MAAPQWRVWTYEQPALVLGCSQRAWYERLIAAPDRPAGEVLLRESGGGAVLIGPWLVGVSVVLPPGHAWVGQSLLGSYRHLGQLHADAMTELGVPAQPLPPAQIPAARAALAAQGRPVVDWACFGNLSPWEVVDTHGRKLVGLAQRRRQHGVLLVAGTLLTDSPWASLCSALERPQDAAVLRQRTVSCAQVVGHAVSPGAWAEILTRRLAHALA